MPQGLTSAGSVPVRWFRCSLMDRRLGCEPKVAGRLPCRSLFEASNTRRALAVLLAVVMSSNGPESLLPGNTSLSKPSEIVLGSGPVRPQLSMTKVVRVLQLVPHVLGIVPCSSLAAPTACHIMIACLTRAIPHTMHDHAGDRKAEGAQQ